MTTQPVSVPIVDDALIEATETYTVNLSAATNATISDPQGVGTILDNDGQPFVSVDDPSSRESAPFLTFTLTLDRSSAVSVSVDYATADGTATAPGDYTTTGGTATFIPGTTSVQVRVPLVNDGVDEPDETLTLTLSNPVNVSILDGQGAGTIVDDDKTPTNLTLKVGKRGSRILARGLLTGATSAMHVKVTLSRHTKSHRSVLGTKTVVLTDVRDRNGDGVLEGAYLARFRRPGHGRYRFKARFPGDPDHLASSRTKLFGL